MPPRVSVYDARPWTSSYGSIPPRLQPPRHRHLAQLVRESAHRFGAGRAFTACMPNGMHGSLTFADVDRFSDQFAVYLREVVGLEAGARVAVQMPNSLSYPIAAFGVFKAGCVLVNVNPLYTTEEMEKQLADSGAELLLIVDMFADKLTEILPRTAIRQVVVASVAQFFPQPVRTVLKGVLRYWNRVIPERKVPAVDLKEALESGRRALEDRRVDVAAFTARMEPDTVALLQYTGGTTGVAKGAMLTHSNLLWNVDQVVAMGRSHLVDGEETVLTALPLYHIFAFTVNLLSFFKVGGHNVLVPSPRPIRNLQRAVENYPVTWITGVNTLFNALLNEEWFSIYPPRRLKAAVAGGAALHAAVATRWLEVTGTPLVEGYGLTESSPLICFNPLSGRIKPGSIGVPVPETEVRLLDEDGKQAEAGEPGELVARGPQVMLGYWNRADETKRTVKRGWLHTGDVAVMDEDGYFRIVDRMKDMVNVSGFNVYPNEVEDCIARLGAVQEVGVIGVPDDKSGEAVCAYIVKRAALTTDEVRRYCKEHLAAYKVPKHVVFCDEIPKTPVGKVLRKDLRARYGRERLEEVKARVR
jgi:long-chain acyl-CoA synthetase